MGETFGPVWRVALGVIDETIQSRREKCILFGAIETRKGLHPFVDLQHLDGLVWQALLARLRGRRKHTQLAHRAAILDIVEGANKRELRLMS